MIDKWRVPIKKLPTGVPGLDQVLGGGLPEFSFSLIAGPPGSGKTTLAHQILFHNASADRPALYFTVLGEPPLKMLRYQQQMGFFAPEKVDDSIHFVSLSHEVLHQDLGKVLQSIVREVDESSPRLVVVDSFRTLVRVAEGRGEMELQGFVQMLAIHLTSWEATTFLVGEYLESEMRDNPVFTVADGILWLSQHVDRNSVVRKLQVMKMRGQAPLPGLHTFRITDAGLQVFPRTIQRMESEKVTPLKRISSGIPGMDAMMGGGMSAGDSILLAGPSGSGKTVFATHFVAEGVKQGEPGVIAIFEEHPQEYLARASSLGFDLEAMVRRGDLKVIYLRPLDLSVDETLLEILESVQQLGAKRVVIDSLSGFELALAPTFREDFRESLYRMVGTLTGGGVAVLMTVEVVEAFDQLRFSPHEVSFLSDVILLLRYVEIQGQLRRVLSVVKMRHSDHSKDWREYQITSHGMALGGTLERYRGIITGVPVPWEEARQAVYPGLTDQEAAVLQALIEIGEGPAPALVQRTGLRRSDLTRALDRLVTLGYALKVTEGGRALYRPLARALGE